MKLIGLTGGSGSGKTTAAEIFAECGAAIIDSDILARKVVLPGMPALEKIEATFGKQYLFEDGSLDRASLGRLVFSDAEKLKQLNGIMIPAISALITDEVKKQESLGTQVVILDAPLLFEYHLDEQCDAVVLMSTPLETRIERLVKRDGLTETEILNRIGSQSDYSSYSDRSSYLLDATDAAILRKEVRRIYQLVTEA